MAETIVDVLSQQRWLDPAANAVRRGVHAIYEAAGPGGGAVKNAMHGVFLGHPLHPVFTDIPIGAWTAALVLDALETSTGDPAYGRGADVAIATASAYLGGGLVYRDRIGVTHADDSAPDDYVRVASSTVPDGAMRHVDASGTSVLIVREHGTLCAVGQHCTHLGGPLSEGQLKDGRVVCPWHGSEFDVRSGKVVNGPATHPLPCYEVRERNGAIEVGPMRH